MSLTAILATLGVLIGGAGVGGLLKTWFDHRERTRAQTDEVAMQLVQRLEARVEKLEEALQDERARCDAELSVHRHEIKGLWQLIYSMLHLFDVPAAKRKEMMVGVRQQVGALQQASAVEKAVIKAAAIAKEPAE